MKKVLFALFVTAVFTACHSTTESDVQKSDSTKTITPVDTTKVDSVKKIVNTIKK